MRSIKPATLAAGFFFGNFTIIMYLVLLGYIETDELLATALVIFLVAGSVAAAIATDSKK